MLYQNSNENFETFVTDVKKVKKIKHGNEIYNITENEMIKSIFFNLSQVLQEILTHGKILIII